MMDDSLASTVMMHRDLIYHDNWKTVVRRDNDKLKNKVRIIGGGAVIDGPMYTGFIGPGMLTAAILTLHGNASSVPSTDTIFHVVKHCVKNYKQAGVLLLIHGCPEYFLNFFQAKKKAEDSGIAIKIIFVKDEISSKLSPKIISSPQSPSGLLLLYKIAGAMSEVGKNLDEIYIVCDEIIKKGSVYSIGVNFVQTINGPVQIEINRGDRLTDQDVKRFQCTDLSSKEIVNNINQSIHASNCEKFPKGSKLAILLDYFGKFTELESNNIIRELIRQLNQYQHTVKPIFAGSFRTSLESNGFHLSILNLSRNKDIEYYLLQPTLAYYWPKSINSNTNFEANRQSKSFPHKKTDSNSNSSSISYDDLIVFEKENSESSKDNFTEIKIFIKAVECACEALIACAKNIDLLDKPSIPEGRIKCGTRLAEAAKVIKHLIQEKEFLALSLSDMLFRISLVFEQDEEDPQSQLYMNFFDSMHKIIVDRTENDEKSDIKDWMYAFDKAIVSVNEVAKDSRLEDVFLVAREAFDDAYFAAEFSPIDAVGEAVLFAQKQTSHVISDTGKIPEKYLNDKCCGYDELAGAYAAGIWMRGAYEGMKLMYQYYNRINNKRTASDNSEDDYYGDVRNEKSVKRSRNDSSSS